MSSLRSRLIVLSLLVLGLVLAGYPVAGLTQVQAAEFFWEFQTYRLTMPMKTFWNTIPKQNLGFLYVNGPPPAGLVPALGTIDKVESEPGEFSEGYGYIWLYVRGSLGFVSKERAYMFNVKPYLPNGTLSTWMSIVIPISPAGVFEGTMAVYLSSTFGALGIWRLEFQAQREDLPPLSLFNATCTLGKYIADVSVSGLPSDLKSELSVDGMRLGEISSTTNVALGWLPQHTITIHDVALDRSASRYHVLQPEVKVSGPGQYNFEYGLQHYLDVESPYPANDSGWYDHGKTVVVSAPAQEASKDTRVVFRGWSGDYLSKDAQISLVMDGPKHISAQYVTQYLLTVVSPVGNPQGSGWYDAGSSATFSVTSPATDGVMGMLGGKHIFDRWSGGSNAATTTASVMVDGPKTVTAEWRADYTMPIVVLGVIAAVVVATAVFLFLKRRRKA